MKKFNQPREELARAWRAIEDMKRSTSLDDFEEAWKEFLHRIERVWSKSESHFARHGAWAGWRGKFLDQRKNDPLLSYLRNARGAEEHTIAEITARQPGGIKIGATGPAKLYSLVIAEDGRVFADATGPMYIQALPERVVLKEVINRGIAHPPPTAHLAAPIDPGQVPRLAELAHAYYERFLDAAGAYFKDK